jgi:hypothetical protein
LRIEEIGVESVAGARRARARIVWEEREREPRTLYFDVPEASAEGLRANPHAFLLAAAVPALRAGEARVRVAGTLCPSLVAGLREAMARLSAWFKPGRRLPEIEAELGFETARPGPARRALFLSGGVDSLALLRRNRLEEGTDGADSFRDAIFVDGFDIYFGNEDGGDFFERALAQLTPIADEARLELLPVRTNLRALGPPMAWVDEWIAAGTAAVAHLFSHRFDRVSIAASPHVGDLIPMGTHPEIDPLYSSAGLRIEHDGVDERRIEKVARIADWPAGLRGLRVCWQGIRPDGPLNCSRCHKCVLTMLELLAAGRLGDCPTFDTSDVTLEMTNALRPTTASSIGYYRELLAPLRARGRPDLAEALEHKLAVHAEFQRRRNAPDWWRRLRWGSKRHLARWAHEAARVDATTSSQQT